MTTTDLIRQRLDAIASAARTGADALGGATLNLCEGTLAQLLAELDALAGRLDLVLDRLAGAAVGRHAGPPVRRSRVLTGRRGHRADFA
jgi:hypothetical protein